MARAIVLPFPARNPRRGDDLLLELRVLIFDRIEVEPRNFIYADEANPFDVYRALGQLHARYTRALEPLGKATVITSTHSSKTLSLGVMLASSEYQLPVVTAEAHHYDLHDQHTVEQLLPHTKLLCLWLLGEPSRQADTSSG